MESKVTPSVYALISEATELFGDLGRERIQQIAEFIDRVTLFRAAPLTEEIERLRRELEEARSR